jgi:hypothetical protein
MLKALTVLCLTFGLNSYLAAATSNHPEEPLVFYFNGEVVERVPKIFSARPAASPIPNTLVMPPGIYRFEGGSYDLRKEGLYRFLLLEKENLQRIVYQKDIDSFLSAVSWVRSHGSKDDQKSMDQLTEQALQSKLLITCGTVCRWGDALLTSKGIKDRLVASETLEPPNSFDDGHSLIEVWRDKWHKWVLYDLDCANYFVDRQSQIPMSLIEFAQAVADKDNYKTVRISLAEPLDVGNFKSPGGYDYAFYMEAVFTHLQKWYERVMQAPLIYDDRDKIFYYYVPALTARLKPNSGCKFLPHSEFMAKFYPQAGASSPK